VEDMAQLMADAVAGEADSTLDAVGPETFTFEELVRLVAGQVGRSVSPIHFPMPLAYVCTRLTGWIVGDVVLTWEEYKGLMANLLAPEGSPSGKTRLSEWLAENCENIGRHYASELARHYARAPSGD
jgi:NADH dehydrogenase